MIEIEKIIRIVKKEVKKFEIPSVTKISKKHTPFEVLISCLLSLRTKDEVTRKAAGELFKLAKTPKEILKLTERQIAKAIYPVGFYKTKAKRIKEICKDLIEKYNSEVPDSIEELLELKGVGRKTAAVTMVYGHKKLDFIPVDVHVHIIANRLGWVRTKTPEKTMEELMKIVPKRYWYDLNDLFVRFGQNVCFTISPFCSKCVISKFCPKVGVTHKR